MSLCKSCGESETKEPNGLYCAECIEIISEELAKGNVYTGIGNVKRIKNE